MITLASASAEGLIIFMHNGTGSEAKLQETRFQTRVNFEEFLKLYTGAVFYPEVGRALGFHGHAHRM